ncbi:MAG: ribbon-helix-helix protein, CopG family [Clostridia bacterium]
MIRKQIYLPADEDQRFKEIAMAEGRSESAVIRDAIRSRLDEEDEREAAWQRLEKLLQTLAPVGMPAGRFNRSDAYRGRLERYDHSH